MILNIFKFNRTKILLLCINVVILGFAGLFVSADPTQAGISNSPETVRVVVDDGSGNPITNANVTLRLGPLLSGYFCGYAGQNSNWTGTHVGGGQYRFNNGGGELQVCCDLQTFFVDVSAPGFQNRTIDVTDQILGNNGYTTTIPVSLTPNAVTPTPIGVIWNCNSTSSVSAAIAWTADPRQTFLWVDEGNNGSIDRSISIGTGTNTWSGGGFAPNTDVKFAVVGGGVVLATGIARTPPCGSTTLGPRPQITPCEHNCWPDATLSWNKDAMWFITWCANGGSSRGSDPGENGSNGGVCNNTSGTRSSTSYSRSFATGFTYYWWVDILLINSSGNPQWFSFDSGNFSVSCSGGTATCSRTINWSNPTQVYQATYAGTLYNACDGVPATEGCSDTGTTTSYPSPSVTIRNVAPNQSFDAYVWIRLGGTNYLFNTVANAGRSGACTCTLQPPTTTNPGSLRVSVFKDLNSNGIQDAGEEDVQISEAPGTVVRRGSTSGPLMPLISGAYLRYGENLYDGNYQVYFDPDTTLTLTRYSYTAPNGSVYTSAAYASPGGGWFNTILVNIDNDKITRVKLGVQVSNLPDLTITSGYPSHPATFTVGVTATIAGKVHNSGAVATTVAIRTRFCVNNSNCYTNTTGVLGTEPGPGVGVLAAGADSITVTRPWTPAATGTYTIYFCADVIPVPPPGNVLETNDTAASNCANTGPLVVTGPGPDLAVTSSNPGTSTWNDTDLISFSGCVENQGTLDANQLNIFSNVTVRKNSDSSIVYNQNQYTPPIVAGDTLCISWTTTWDPPSVENYNYIMCADSTGVVPESDEGNNCAGPFTLTITSAAAEPYVITENGNVGSVGSLSNLDIVGRRSSSTQSNVEYIRQTTAVTGFFESWKRWLVNQTPDLSATPNTFTKLNEALYGSNACPLASATNIPNSKGKFRITGDLTLNGAYSAAVSCPITTTRDAAVIFVTGNLTINNDLNYGNSRPTVFIVSGNVTVASTVKTIRATLISNEAFDDGSSTTDALTVYGSVISNLDNGLLTRTRLRREIPGTTGESERFILQARDFYHLIDFAGVSRTSYREENP